MELVLRISITGVRAEAVTTGARLAVTVMATLLLPVWYPSEAERRKR
jgi:hypothetical protein